MIKPSVMDGIPEEEGYRWRANKDEDKWFMEYIYEDVDEDTGEEFLYFQTRHSTIYENRFSEYTWSEKIAEPTTDVDNLSDG